jgi:Ohr subfamily peroxiredoxin
MTSTSEKTPEKVVYTARASVQGGRSGHGRTDDGLLDVTLAPPKEMGGPGGATNPEQLFAVGYAACFQSALGSVGRKEGVDTSSSTVHAEVGIGRVGQGYGLQVDLRVELPGVDPQVARTLVEQAHQVCPYSNATRGNIPVTVGLA